MRKDRKFRSLIYPGRVQCTYIVVQYCTVPGYPVPGTVKYGSTDRTVKYRTTVLLCYCTRATVYSSATVRYTVSAMEFLDMEKFTS